MQEVGRIVNDPRNDIKQYDNVNENLIRLEYAKTDEFTEDLPHTNCIIAAFVTCHARLTLYGYLDKLGDRVSYYDTDSVFYEKQPGSYEPPTGDFLGDMKDELDGAFVTEFVATGPKSYAFATSDGKETIKMKGFR